MNNYHVALALSYLKEKQERYTISELKELLGYTQQQLDNLIDQLFQSGYICYNSNLIEITPKAIIFLISNNFDEMNVNNFEFNMIKIIPGKALPIDQPYVPKNFINKYNG